MKWKLEAEKLERKKIGKKIQENNGWKYREMVETQNLRRIQTVFR